MELFREQINPDQNLLPKDGATYYFGSIMERQVADYYFHNLLEDVAWKQDQAVIFGKHILTKRKVAWYGDENYRYTYSKTTKQALNWTKELLELKLLVERLTNEKI